MSTLDAVVVGGGMGGLTAAHRLLGHGLRPVVLEAQDRVGGTVMGGTVGGLTLDLGAESFALRRPEAARLAEELGLAVEHPAGGGSSVWDAGEGPGRAVAIPDRSMLGIPADPEAPDVVAVIGPQGAARAAQDRRLGPHVGADAEDLATLVRARMGEAVLERLVRPIAGGIHAADPAALAVDAVAPGLRRAMAEHGSLADAVGALRRQAPGSVVATTVGGLFRLPEALGEAVGQVRTRCAVTALRPTPGGWEVVVGDEPLHARRVVLATPGPVALRLLAGLVPGTELELPTGSPIVHVTLVVRAPELDAAPRGAGLLVAPGAGDVHAKALTHVTAKWPWAAAGAPPGVHVLRVSYGRPGQGPNELAQVGPGTARRDASRLLGTDLTDTQVLASRVVRWDGALPPATPRLRSAVAAVREQAEARTGLAVTGAWVAGTGVSAVVADARATADRLADASR